MLEVGPLRAASGEKRDLRSTHHALETDMAGHWL